jgi:phage repressor protein C with HTH and peptisase S24 domain
MDMVRKLILEKLTELGLNMAEVSAALGRNPTYLHQFMKRGVPAELHERERLRLAEILKVPESELRGPSNPLPTRSYTVKPEVALPRSTKMSQAAHNLVDIGSAVPQLFGSASDLPVFGTAQGGHGGALIMSSEAVDFVIRPAPLLKVKDGYGMIVAGDSMSPQFEGGSIALVNPHRPPRSGDTCVFRSPQDDGTVLAVIKRLRRFTDDTWFVSQFNPAKDFTLKRSEWQICHPTVGSYFV